MSRVGRQFTLVLLVGGLALWPTTCSSPTRVLPDAPELMMFSSSGPHAFDTSVVVAFPDGSHMTTLIPAGSTVGYEAAHGNSLSQYLLVYIAELGPAGTQVNKLQMYRPLLNMFEVISTPPGGGGPSAPSPDGSMYATVDSPSDVPWEARVWTVNLRGGTTTQLTPYDGLAYQDSFPVWSPDGRWIAFLRLDFSQAPNYRVNVYRVRPDGTELTSLIPGDEFINAITYTPDGRLVMDSRNGIELFDLTTMQRTVILPLSAFPSTVRGNGEGIGWSRTLNTIVWPMINRSLNRYEMWSVKPDGTDFHMLFSTDRFIAQMSFVAR